MDYFSEIHTINTGFQKYSSLTSSSYWSVDCPECMSKTMLAIATGACPERYQKRSNHYAQSAWLMCVSCGVGAFAIGLPDKIERVIPKPEPFGMPDNLSPEVSRTWDEAVKSFSASAFTGCALMCRKIIYHMAVEFELPAKNAGGRSPGFEECVDHLIKVGHITQRQKDQWVDSIRKWGNTATHELAATTEETAYSALQFTFQLLQMVYSFPSAVPSTGGKNGDPQKQPPVPAKS